MRQRNDSGFAVLVAADPPVRVEPGETVDLPTHVVGLTEVAAKSKPEPKGQQQ